MDNSDQIRFFISPRISISNSDATNFESAFNYQETKDEYIKNSYSIGIGSDYLWGLIKNKDVQMYGGSGIMFLYGDNYEKRTTTLAHSIKDINKTITRPSYGIGLRGILGVEWKVSKRIGIHSEYILALSYNYSKTENKSFINISNYVVETTRTVNGVFLSTKVLFGVSIYL